MQGTFASFVTTTNIFILESKGIFVLPIIENIFLFSCTIVVASGVLEYLHAKIHAVLDSARVKHFSICLSIKKNLHHLRQQIGKY